MSTAQLLSTEMTSVPAWVIRGGTSKGVFILEEDLPEDRSSWAAYLIDMFGARDARQIDGIGGAMPTTSKCCIIGASRRRGIDVDYTFAQIGIGEERVYWDYNCGNLTPAVGTFAILAGLVAPTPTTTTVRIYQTNTRLELTVEVPTSTTGAPLVAGEYRNAGVSGSGAAVSTDFSRSTGASLGGALFPTGNRVDSLAVRGVGEVRCTIVDLANMCVFVRAEDVGLTGMETPADGPLVVGTFTAIREAAQDLLSVDRTKTTPWPVVIGGPRPYTTLQGEELGTSDYDFGVRFAGIQPMRDTLHEAFPGTASSCTAVTAVTPGTVVNEVFARTPHAVALVRMAHPSGVMAVEAATHEEGGECVVDRVVNYRTVRPIMRGELLVRRSEVARLTALTDPEDPMRWDVPPAYREGTTA